MNRERGEVGSKSRPLRIALVGAGAISETHARILKTIPEVELVAVCDTDTAKAFRLQQRWRIPDAFSSLSDMLRNCRLDAAQIVTPPAVHCETAMTCMEAGCDVLVEKPLVVSAAECAQLRVAASATGRTVGVNQNMVFHPTLLRLIDLVSQCRLGELQHVTIFVNLPLRQLDAGQHEGWMFQQPGNIVLEQGPHSLSMAQRLMGVSREFRALASGLRTLRSGRPFYSTWQISSQAERGTAQVYIGVGKECFELSVVAIGQDAIACADLQRNLIRLHEKRKFTGSPGHVMDALSNGWRTGSNAIKNLLAFGRSALDLGPASDGYYLSMRSSIGAFYRALSESLPVPNDLESGLSVVEGCLSIIEDGLATDAVGAIEYASTI